MIYILLIASLCTLFFLIRYLSMRQQVKSIIEQLEDHNNQKKISVALTDRLIETLALRINEQIDLQHEMSAEKIQVDRELKHAIAGMSHDLRTPLTAIIGYIELIEKSNQLAIQEQHYLTVAKKRAIHLQHLINNFFALSTADTDDYPMQLEKIHMNIILKETIMDYFDQFKEANQEPTINIPNENLKIVCDRNAVKRVLENLFLNALQHSSGDIQVDLGTTEDKVILTVKNKVDEMININNDQLFERFFTIDQTRQYSRGLGLSIVKSLMEKMNGEIFVMLEDGEFNITCMWPKSLN